MARERKEQLSKARKKGASSYEDDRGPNTGRWEVIVGQEAPGARAKYSREWNSKYNGPGRGTW